MAGVLGLDASLALGALRLEVALEIAPGETVALVGPSGAGKTTCLALVAGLLSPDRGRVALGDEVWCDTARGVDLPPNRRHVGFVHPDYALFPHLTLRGNVAYGLRARGASRRQAAAGADAWLERLGLTGLGDRPLARLSSGQRQRVALARALASGARVLLLDEPLAALDVTTRAAVRAELRAFLRQAGLPALFVSHDATDALALADRIAVLEAGALTQCGTRAELLSRPRTPFVAELVGLNLFRAEVGPGGELRDARAGGLALHVLAHGLDGQVCVAFPPSAVTLGPDAPESSARNTFAGRIAEIVPLADRVRVVLDAGVPIAADVTHEAAAKLRLAPGATVWASVKATAIDVYP